jgi:hypothetical protein
MENLTYAELVSILGQEAADAIISQREGTQGVKIPFPIIKVISDALGNDLGAFGELVVGAERAKEGEGYESLGTNFGKGMEFVVCGYAFQFKNYMEGAGKNGSAATVRSNMFRNLSEYDLATYNGARLPKGKEAKSATGWKLTRINVGLARKDAKSPWLPVIFEVSNTMLYGFGVLLDKASNNGVLSNILSIRTSHKKKGSTVFVVIDETTSTVEPLPVGFLKDNSEVIKDVLNKFKEYVDAKSDNTATQEAPKPNAPVDNTENSGW